MKVKQIVNNNVVVSENESGEIIVIGKGIGFNGKVGQEIDPARIEKTYILQNKGDESGNLKLLLEEIPYEVVSFGIKATDYIIRCSNQKIKRRIIIPLTDHIYSCLERYKDGIKFDSSLNLNISFLYRDEYKIACDVVDMINSEFNVEVPNEEAAFIALHIVNAELDINTKDTYAATEIIDISIRTVEEYFNVKLENDMNLARFLTHLQFFAKRMIKNTFIEEDDLDINKHINLRYPNEYQCAKLIGQKIEEKFKVKVDQNEYTYLTIHIARLFHHR